MHFIFPHRINVCNMDKCSESSGYVLLRHTHPRSSPLNQSGLELEGRIHCLCKILFVIFGFLNVSGSLNSCFLWYIFLVKKKKKKKNSVVMVN
uniref:Uncharacterized protein n=1 Tax=Anguilla anguilla TaxID=7936 RepID=A0A0E9WNU1_ANGAN